MILLRLGRNINTRAIHFQGSITEITMLDKVSIEEVVEEIAKRLKGKLVELLNQEIGGFKNAKI